MVHVQYLLCPGGAPQEIGDRQRSGGLLPLVINHDHVFSHGPCGAFLSLRRPVAIPSLVPSRIMGAMLGCYRTWIAALSFVVP